MATTITLSQIAIVVVVAEVIIGYLFWRLIRDIRPNYSFRAYDYLFLTIAAILLISRVVSIVSIPEAFSQASILDYFRIWDLRLDYFVIVLIPVLVYQFVVFNVERYAEWKPHALKFLLFGELFALPVFLGQVIRVVITELPQEYFVMHLVLFIWLLLNIFLVLLRLLREDKLLIRFLNFYVLSALLIVGWAVIRLLIQESGDDNQVLISIFAQFALLVVVISPFIERPKREQPKQLLPR